LVSWIVPGGYFPAGTLTLLKSEKIGWLARWPDTNKISRAWGGTPCIGIELVAVQQLAVELYVSDARFYSMLWETLLILCIEIPVALDRRGIEFLQVEDYLFLCNFPIVSHSVIYGIQEHLLLREVRILVIMRRCHCDMWLLPEQEHNETVIDGNSSRSFYITTVELLAVHRCGGKTSCVPRF
jgi:hypothetical protein